MVKVRSPGIKAGKVQYAPRPPLHAAGRDGLPASRRIQAPPAPVGGLRQRRVGGPADGRRPASCQAPPPSDLPTKRRRARKSVVAAEAAPPRRQVAEAPAPGTRCRGDPGPRRPGAPGARPVQEPARTPTPRRRPPMTWMSRPCRGRTGSTGWAGTPEDQGAPSEHPLGQRTLRRQRYGQTAVINAMTLLAEGYVLTWASGRRQADRPAVAAWCRRRTDEDRGRDPRGMGTLLAASGGRSR